MSGIKPTGRHLEKRLSAATVRAIKTPGLHGDGNGLYLKVDPSGAKRWIQRLMIEGKRRDIGLGSASFISLAEARERALENRKLARTGGDPLAAKKRSMDVLTFKAAAEKVHELSKPNWRNDKHGDQWINTLTTYVFPFFGSKRIDTVGSADVLAALSPIWNSHPETARRVKQRVGSVFKWAMANGWRTDNPADAIGKALPKHDRSKVKHREALPYDAVETAIGAVAASEAGLATKLAFEFLVLTATRSGETREAVWGEFDLENATWTIPAARMKAKKPHRIPLPPRCLAILADAKTLKRESDDYVFPGTKDKKPLSDMTLSKLMKDLGIAAVPHGFRSSFRDWAGEQTHHPREVIEFALAHVIKDKAEAAYARSDLFEKRRALMSDWSDYLKRG
ncbi:tyrosine-type recombinase/integrase [Sphingomonas sp. CFBP9021]|uniref:tyrosine-type recombinase/integrase n=1 Tax=Sphingomonas sp. CFBP9021 TaxID=3096534 RepID=UPI002A69CEC5|nr:integrase arm-type DNA-binding domain-containing protein [Sphingomonas sp. CFBP9021]MDY0967581.1 tyrosine-type recombinase/integrase [Sphingomonas sp. CFBP9021]